MIKQRKLIDNKNEEIKFDENLNLSLEENNIEEEFEQEQLEYDFNDDYKKIQTLVTYENEDYIHLAKLNTKIDEIFKNSRWAIINPNKKIPKDLIPLIFQDILKELENSEFTMVEKFVAICDYTAINYAKAYEAIHMKYKELIIQEMDKKYKILQKKGIKKIF